MKSAGLGVIAVTMVAGAALAADAPRAPVAHGPQFIYVCQSAPPFAIRFFDTVPRSAQLKSEGRTIELMIQPAASGARYAGAGTEFWGKGQEAMLTGADGVRHACRVAHQGP